MCPVLSVCIATVWFSAHIKVNIQRNFKVLMPHAHWSSGRHHCQQHVKINDRMKYTYIVHTYEWYTQTGNYGPNAESLLLDISNCNHTALCPLYRSDVRTDTYYQSACQLVIDFDRLLIVGWL